MDYLIILVLNLLYFLITFLMVNENFGLIVLPLRHGSKKPSNLKDQQFNRWCVLLVTLVLSFVNKRLILPITSSRKTSNLTDLRLAKY